MSPAPTKTGSADAVVLNVQVGPVVVRVASLAVTNHSNVWPAPIPVQGVVVVVPEATAVFCAICTKLPLEKGRPNHVTVIALPSGSVTLTPRVGEVDWPVAPVAGAGFEGALGAAARTSVAGTTANIDATSATMDSAISDRPRVEAVNVDLVRNDPDRPRRERSIDPTSRAWERPHMDRLPPPYRPRRTEPSGVTRSRVLVRGSVPRLCQATVQLGASCLRRRVRVDRPGSARPPRWSIREGTAPGAKPGRRARAAAAGLRAPRNGRRRRCPSMPSRGSGPPASR